MLTSDSSDPAATAASTDSVGSTHSDPRAYSDSASRRIIFSPPVCRCLPHASPAAAQSPRRTSPVAVPKKAGSDPSPLTWVSPGLARRAAGSEDPPHTGAAIASEHQQRDGELNHGCHTLHGDIPGR